MHAGARPGEGREERTSGVHTQLLLLLMMMMMIGAPVASGRRAISRARAHHCMDGANFSARIAILSTSSSLEGGMQGAGPHGVG